MKKAITLAILGFWLASCQSEVEIPTDILQPEQMEDLMVEANLIEGSLKANFILGDSARKVAPTLYAKMYAEHETTSEVFKKSVDWYFEHPELMEEIQKNVVARLLEMEN